jgi:hypothetical protein
MKTRRSWQALELINAQKPGGLCQKSWQNLHHESHVFPLFLRVICQVGPPGSPGSVVITNSMLLTFTTAQESDKPQVSEVFDAGSTRICAKRIDPDVADVERLCHREGVNENFRQVKE